MNPFGLPVAIGAVRVPRRGAAPSGPCSQIWSYTMVKMNGILELQVDVLFDGFDWHLAGGRRKSLEGVQDLLLLGLGSLPEKAEVNEIFRTLLGIESAEFVPFETPLAGVLGNLVVIVEELDLESIFHGITLSSVSESVNQHRLESYAVFSFLPCRPHGTLQRLCW